MDPLAYVADIEKRRRESAAATARLDSELERAVVQAFEAGRTGPEIASAAGLSKQRVYQIKKGTR